MGDVRVERSWGTVLGSQYGQRADDVTGTQELGDLGRPMSDRAFIRDRVWRHESTYLAVYPISLKLHSRNRLAIYLGRCIGHGQTAIFNVDLDLKKWPRSLYKMCNELGKASLQWQDIRISWVDEKGAASTPLGVRRIDTTVDMQTSLFQILRE